MCLFKRNNERRRGTRPQLYKPSSFSNSVSPTHTPPRTNTTPTYSLSNTERTLLPDLSPISSTTKLESHILPAIHRNLAEKIFPHNFQLTDEHLKWFLYDRLSEDLRGKIHFEIGNLFLEILEIYNWETPNLEYFGDVALFEALNHIAKGLKHVPPGDHVKLACLYLRGAVQAKTLRAFHHAHMFIQDAAWLVQDEGGGWSPLAPFELVGELVVQLEIIEYLKDECKTWQSHFTESSFTGPSFPQNISHLLSRENHTKYKIFQLYLWEKNTQKIMWFHKIIHVFQNTHFFDDKSMSEAVRYIFKKYLGIYFRENSSEIVTCPLSDIFDDQKWKNELETLVCVGEAGQFHGDIFTPMMEFVVEFLRKNYSEFLEKLFRVEEENQRIKFYTWKVRNRFSDLYSDNFLFSLFRSFLLEDDQKLLLSLLDFNDESNSPHTIKKRVKLLTKRFNEFSREAENSTFRKEFRRKIHETLENSDLGDIFSSLLVNHVLYEEFKFYLISKKPHALPLLTLYRKISVFRSRKYPQGESTPIATKIVTKYIQRPKLFDPTLILRPLTDQNPFEEIIPFIKSQLRGIFMEFSGNKIPENKIPDFSDDFLLRLRRLPVWEFRSKFKTLPHDQKLQQIFGNFLNENSKKKPVYLQFFCDVHQFKNQIYPSTEELRNSAKKIAKFYSLKLTTRDSDLLRSMIVMMDRAETEITVNLFDLLFMEAGKRLKEEFDKFGKYLGNYKSVKKSPPTLKKFHKPRKTIEPLSPFDTYEDHDITLITTAAVAVVAAISNRELEQQQNSGIPEISTTRFREYSDHSRNIPEFREFSEIFRNQNSGNLEIDAWLRIFSEFLTRQPSKSRTDHFLFFTEILVFKNTKFQTHREIQNAARKILKKILGVGGSEVLRTLNPMTLEMVVSGVDSGKMDQTVFDTVFHEIKGLLKVEWGQYCRTMTEIYNLYSS